LLFSQQFNKQQKQMQEQNNYYSKGHQKQPNDEPIPAFTSIDVAKKLRYRSEDRYVNEKMEKELIAYKVEIEKRFQKSAMKGYGFPRE
jgi:hypothetical protein